MPRFLIDECLPRAVTRSLSGAGYDAIDARDIGLRGQSDEAVHERAVEEHRVVVTSDLDCMRSIRCSAETFGTATGPRVDLS